MSSMDITARLARDLEKEIETRERDMEQQRAELAALRAAYEALTSGDTVRKPRARTPEKPAARPRKKKADRADIIAAVEAFVQEHAVGTGVFPRQIRDALGFTSREIKMAGDHLKSEGRIKGRGAAKNAQWYWNGSQPEKEVMKIHVQTDGPTRNQITKHENGEVAVAYVTEEPAPQKLRL